MNKVVNKDSNNEINSTISLNVYWIHYDNDANHSTSASEVPVSVSKVITARANIVNNIINQSQSDLHNYPYDFRNKTKDIM